MAKALTMWVVSGSFLLPGSRDKASFGPHRIISESITKASADLAPILQAQFHKELSKVNRQGGPHPFHFSKSFAQMQLKWEVYVSPRAKAEAAKLEAAATGTL
jgi:hypothetical protein